jgi:hypothetical protein
MAAACLEFVAGFVQKFVLEIKRNLWLCILGILPNQSSSKDRGGREGEEEEEEEGLYLGGGGGGALFANRNTQACAN